MPKKLSIHALNNITSAGAVDREFVNIYGLLGPIGPNWNGPIGPNWDPVGPHWVPIGPNWAPLGPIGPYWALLGPGPGCWEVARSQVTRIAIRSAFLELAADATDAAEVVARPAARTPHPTRAGGQDDGSYTNSLK